VDYIVQNTIGKLVSGKLGNGMTPQEVAKLKIVDPACGAPRGAIKQYLKGKETIRIDSSMPQYC
jgi:hypothetical protein